MQVSDSTLETYYGKFVSLEHRSEVLDKCGHNGQPNPT